MTSFIIVSRDKEKRIENAKAFCTKHDINTFDITIVEKEDTVRGHVETRVPSGTRQSIGIADVKKIQHSIFLKPLKSKFKAVIVEDAHLLTKEAQNAMLKVLEEPPEHTLLLLGVDSKEALLPTILSRCQIIELETAGVELTTRDRNALSEFVETLPNMTIGERMKKAELLAKDKDKAVEWVEKLIIIMREKVISQYKETKTLDTPATSDTPDTLKKLQTLHTLLKTTNVNPRFAIENTLLTI